MYGISTVYLSVEQKINWSWQQVGSVLSGQQQSTQNSAWHQASIILNPNSSAIRFKGETDNDNTGDIAINDVLIYSPTTNDKGKFILNNTYNVINSQNHKLNISNILSGTYVIKLYTLSSIITNKIIIH